MILPRCFVCGRPVLELAGQANHLDSYYLTERDEALAAGAYGSCHTTCLLASRWGAFWAERRAEHHTQIMRQPVVGEAAGLLALRNVNLRETLVLRADGLLCTVRDADLPRLRPVEGGYLRRVELAEFNLDLSDRCGLAEAIKPELLRQGSYPLIRLVDALEIRPTLRYLPAIEAGRLVYTRQHQRLWVECWVVAGLSHDELLPAEVVELARAAAV
ncbi:MAG TPA: hypothetical protein VFS21_10855 [Roseiflexaceae bacterium]|nr:hypothetical protein [Roseiflexaceae bacterium]